MKVEKQPYQPIEFAYALEETKNYRSDNNLIYEWVNTHWAARDDVEIERQALNWLKQTVWVPNETNARHALKTALIELPLLSEPSRETVLPFKNGYLHIADDGGKTFSPPDKEMGMRYALNCEYNPDAPAPEKFMKFIRQILPDNNIRSRVQEYLGYTLLPDCRFQRFAMWIGEGANGKGVLSAIIQQLHSSVASAALDDLKGFSLEGLIGASLVCVDETPRKINEETLKTLISGDIIGVNLKNRRWISTRFTGKWIVNANQFPAIIDQSNGFWRRVDIIPFPVVIEEKKRNPNLAREIIDGEMESVLNWVLEGLHRLLKRGRFSEKIPAGMAVIRERARRETNTVLAWVHDLNITIGDECIVLKEDVYKRYNSWCRENGLMPLPAPRFWQQAAALLPGVAEARPASGDRRRVCNVQLL